MVLVTLKTLSLCLLLPIPFGAIVTSLPTPVSPSRDVERPTTETVTQSILPFQIRYKGPKRGDRKAPKRHRAPKPRDDLTRLIPVTLSQPSVEPEHGYEAVNSEPTVLEPIDQHQSLELTHLQPVFAEFQWDVLIGAEETSLIVGHQIPSILARKNEESDPKTNINWPFEIVRGPRTDMIPASVMGDVDLENTECAKLGGPRTARRRLTEGLQAINFHSGPNHHTREAIRILKDYGARFASGLEAGIDKACEEEEQIWHGEEYPALVVNLYGQAEAATRRDAVDKLRWKLHRLFQNNCVAYRREQPEDLHDLLKFGQELCIQLDGNYPDWTKGLGI
ncbi:hypothetical protein EV361DRAFT_497362 [Lentinula raphanica]|uniref:Uncharacterized protein n=1 Tax=Lentinula raphanica TaxID=153919 RepID=A0AA38PHE0_9AGAR|nr:hypothetical protein F5880DRAFT_878783 [Lentinula raphanica]KAJ3842771.1 hypothetical protein F5878DRAFT_657333 [Lentinula raphanica]KAJ3975446.1 hypothetical protein EV361DRAFT_497362 [Lentinula raphanica]